MEKQMGSIEVVTIIDEVSLKIKVKKQGGLI
jgi:hypothetical protein